MAARNRRLAELRGDRTQADVAKALHIDRSTYAHIENGTRRPSLVLAIKIARYYGVPVEELFSPLDVITDHRMTGRTA